MEQINLELGPLRVDNFTQAKMGLIGGPGTGKTTLMKMINYQLSQDYPKLGLYIFDVLNVIHVEGFSRVIVGKGSKDKGKPFARILNKTPGDHVIVSLRDMVQAEQAEFIDALFADWLVRDSIISIDEAHDLCPESAQHGAYCIELERAIRHWRNRNDGFIFASQRPAKLNKNVLELADVLNINRLTGNNDRKAATGYMEGNLARPEVDAIMSDLQGMGFLESYLLNFRAPSMEVKT